MFGTHDLALFIISGLLLNITPGPDNIFIAVSSTRFGWRAGVAAALGIFTGCFIHVFAAAFGLSAILATSATAFTIVKLVGAAYLIWMGIGMLRSRASSADSANEPIAASPAFGKTFVRGFLTNALNPKVALFFLAFVPQFILPDASNKALAFLFLGTLFNVDALLWTLSLAMFAAALSARVKASGKLSLWFNRMIGGLFIGLGLKLALSDRH